jgi:SAM-dependent methyltransferase
VLQLDYVALGVWKRAFCGDGFQLLQRRRFLTDYYGEKLSAERLRRVYEIATPRVLQYLEAELAFALASVRLSDTVLELGCGYGRILARLAEKTAMVVGIDTSMSSLLAACDLQTAHRNLFLARMDAVRLGFADCSFDAVICIQNGISAFHRNQKELMRESVRVTRPGGAILYSSYSPAFWDNRLEWFRLQSEAGLLGDIDYTQTRNGNIVCEDGFSATTVGPDQFRVLADGLDVDVSIVEVDSSSLFCKLVRKSLGR